MKHIDIVQGVVYRRKSGGTEFLVLKRTPEDGGFWQAVTGTIEDGEKTLETLKRELIEEAGLTTLLHVSDMLHTYEWAIEDLTGRDNVFTVEVDADVQVILNPEEHEEFRWLPLDRAVKLLKYDGNKLSMRQAAEYVLKRPI